MIGTQTKLYAAQIIRNAKSVKRSGTLSIQLAVGLKTRAVKNALQSTTGIQLQKLVANTGIKKSAFAVMLKTRAVKNALQLTTGIQKQLFVAKNNTGIMKTMYAARKAMKTALVAKMVKYGMQFKELVALLEILDVKIAKARINGILILFAQFAALTSTIQLLNSANVHLDNIILRRIFAAPNDMMLVPRPALVQLELTMRNRTLVAHHNHATLAIPQIPGMIS